MGKVLVAIAGRMEAVPCKHALIVPEGVGEVAAGVNLDGAGMAGRHVGRNPVEER